jgi:uncharacterized protein YggE
MVAVESHGTTAQLAAGSNARKMDAVFVALKKFGIVPPHVATVQYALEPEYAPYDSKVPTPLSQRIIGYTARNMVRVEVDSMPLAGSVIDATVAAGANRIDQLSFELRDMTSAQMEALKQAVANARAQADVIAAAAGQHLGLPLNINTSYSYPRPVMQMAYARMAGDAAAAPPPTPVEAGNLTVTASVNITYKLEDH